MLKPVDHVEVVLPDARTWQVFYDQGDTGACFPAGTLVETACGGHKPIEEIRPLDFVRTAEGRANFVSKTMVRMHLEGGGLLRIKLRGHSHLRCTPEHPILTSRGYVPASMLRIGDEVRLPAVAAEVTTEVSTTEWLAEKERYITSTGVRYAGVMGRTPALAVRTPVPERIALTPRFGWIVGLWLAEGSTSAHKLMWSFGGHERDTLVPQLEGYLRDELGVEPRRQVRGNGSINVVLHGKGWARLFERMLSLGPYNKRLPDELASGSKDFLRAVFDGWLAGDGHKRPKRRVTTGVTVSHSLAMAMYRIAQILGYSPTIRESEPSMNRHAKTRRKRWDVEISENPQARHDEGGAWRKVVGLEHEDWAGWVYNLEVEGDHSYVAEGIGVHNCVGYGCSRMMSLLNRKRYDARWLWERARLLDEFTDNDDLSDLSQGTTVRAGCEALRTLGHVSWLPRYAPSDPMVRFEERPVAQEGIAAYRWATTVDEVRASLASKTPVAAGTDWLSAFDSPTAVRHGSTWEAWIGQGQWERTTLRGGHCWCIGGASDQRQAVAILNSWGKSWPQRVWMPYTTLEALIGRSGEMALVSDR